MNQNNKIPTAIQELKTKIRCGQCSGLERDNLVNGSRCSEQGMLPTSKPCGSFRPDSFSVADEVQQNGALLALAHLISKIPSAKLDLVAAMIQNDKKTRKQKMCFGQRVYVRYRGLANANYMSNFMQAFILDAGKDYIRIMSRDGSCTLTYENDGNGLSGPAIYSKAAFDKLRAVMVEKGNEVDPDEERNQVKRLRAIEAYRMEMASDSADGQITTIDTVFEENDLPRGKSGVNDLVSIVREIEGGFDLKRTRTGDSYRRKPSKKRRNARDESVNIS